MNEQQQSYQALQDIKQMMERSSRFISLSGLSGIAAGSFGLIGAAIAFQWIRKFYESFGGAVWGEIDYTNLKWKLFALAIITMCFALMSGFYFTWKKAKRTKVEIWNSSSKRLLINLCIPLMTGGVFIIAMLLNNEWKFIGPACLLFYGLALINGSKYTLDEVRYLGMLEILLGCINLFLTGYGLLFWAAGFGILHIVYGILMWNKYERKTTE